MSVVRDVIVNVPEACSIRCPYTGDLIVIHMYVRPGSVTYSAPDAFTLAEPVKGLNTLIDRSTMRNGVSGSVDRTDGKFDVRTGVEMRLRDLGDDRFCYAGGFNPRAAFDSLESLMEGLQMVNGTKTYVAPSRQEAVKPSRHRELKHVDTEIGQATFDHAVDVVQKSGAFQKKTSVRVGGKSK